MKRKIMIWLAACVAAAPLQAQNLEFGGLTYNNDLMMSTDFAALSRSHPFGTARVMGMGGAFTSLGADLSSMSINPAGLGMYRHGDISITPMMSFARSFSWSDWATRLSATIRSSRPASWVVGDASTTGCHIVR